jgi:hypothetical protein
VTKPLIFIAPDGRGADGVERHPDDVALDRKIGSICRGVDTSGEESALLDRAKAMRRDV